MCADAAGAGAVARGDASGVAAPLLAERRVPVSKLATLAVLEGIIRWYGASGERGSGRWRIRGDSEHVPMLSFLSMSSREMGGGCRSTPVSARGVIRWQGKILLAPRSMARLVQVDRQGFGGSRAGTHGRIVSPAGSPLHSASASACATAAAANSAASSLVIALWTLTSSATPASACAAGACSSASPSGNDRSPGARRKPRASGLGERPPVLGLPGVERPDRAESISLSTAPTGLAPRPASSGLLRTSLGLPGTGHALPGAGGEAITSAAFPTSAPGPLKRMGRTHLVLPRSSRCLWWCCTLSSFPAKHTGW